MKRFLRMTVVAVVALFAFSSCSLDFWQDKVEDMMGDLLPNPSGKYYLNKVENAILVFDLPNGVSTDPMEFSCDSDWSLTADANWINLYTFTNSTQGEANVKYVLKISCNYVLSENESVLPRTGHVYLDCDAFEEPKLIITITQTRRE